MATSSDHATAKETFASLAPCVFHSPSDSDRNSLEEEWNTQGAKDAKETTVRHQRDRRAVVTRQSL